MLLNKQSTKIEKETYDNNLLFYTILKTLVQCKLTEQKMISFQSLIYKTNQTLNSNAVKLKASLLSSEQVIKIDGTTRSSYDNLINLLDVDKAQMWLDMVDISIDYCFLRA